LQCEPVFYVRIFGIHCAQGRLINPKNGQDPLTEGGDATPTIRRRRAFLPSQRPIFVRRLGRSPLLKIATRLRLVGRRVHLLLGTSGDVPRNNISILYDRPQRTTGRFFLTPVQVSWEMSRSSPRSVLARMRVSRVSGRRRRGCPATSTALDQGTDGVQASQRRTG